MHGANSRRGLAHPNWKDGRRSSLLAKASRELAESYEAALEDPELEALRKDIATLEARTQQLLGRLTPDGAQSWPAAAAMYEVLQFAIAEGAEESIKEAMKKLGQVIAGGVADQAVWGELYGVMEQRRRLADTEGRNLERMDRAITEQHMMTLFGAVVYLINQHVKDQKARQKISEGLNLIARGEAGAQPVLVTTTPAA